MHLLTLDVTTNDPEAFGSVHESFTDLARVLMTEPPIVTVSVRTHDLDMATGEEITDLATYRINEPTTFRKITQILAKRWTGEPNIEKLVTIAKIIEEIQDAGIIFVEKERPQ